MYIMCELMYRVIMTILVYHDYCDTQDGRNNGRQALLVACVGIRSGAMRSVTAVCECVCI